MRRTLAALPLFFLSSALAADLLLPEAKHAEAITVPTTRVEIAADGTAQYEGRSWGMLDTTGLVEPLRAWHAGTPTGLLLVAGDRRVDFRAVRGVLKAAGNASVPEVGLQAAGGTLTAIRLAIAAKDAPDLEPVGDVPPPLTLHLRATSTVVTRRSPDGVDVPNRLGARDLDALDVLIAEDRRLHPSAHLVVVNTDDGVPYGQTFAVVDLARGQGYLDTVLAGGPAAWSADTNAPPPLEARTFVLPFSVRLEPGGDAVLALTDGSEKRLSHADVVGYTAGCDATLCDVVAYTALDAYQLGAAPVEALRLGALFGRRVTRTSGRLGGPKIRVEGVFSPLVQVPGAELPARAGTSGGPILLGTLDKTLIDAGIKARMSDVRGCYDRLLKRDPKAAGKVTIKFVIAANGSVSSAAVKDTTVADPEMLDCLTATFRTFDFPEPKGGGIVIVSYPFVFSPA